MSQDLDTHDSTLVLSRGIFNAFAPHAELEGKQEDSLRGWETCSDIHTDELESICDGEKAYCTLLLNDATITEFKLQNPDFVGRPTSAAVSVHRMRKKPIATSPSSMCLRKTKSSRCIASTPNLSSISSRRTPADGSLTAPPSGRIGMGSKRNHRAQSDPSLRYVSKFPMLFHGLKDISYKFQHFQHHQQHIESYRSSYTYILIRNFRELRASGLAGVKLHAALRLKLCSTSSKQYTEDICRGLLHTHRDCHHHAPKCSAPPKKPAVTPPPVVYYSENCPTGPVLYNRTGSGRSTSSKGSDVLLSTVNPSAICGGCMNVPKSTMEVNNPMMIKSSQQRPFGEQETAGYKGHKSLAKSPKPWKPQSSEFTGKRKTNQTNQMSMVVGSSAFGGSKPGGIRKMSPLGRVPVAIRRSSPSIRGKRDPSGTAVEGVKYLSIAMATHTVTSPYYRNNEGQDDSVSML
ncbi:uncharacterized protein LOC100187417 [Ciona intestinalis]